MNHTPTENPNLTWKIQPKSTPQGQNQPNSRFDLIVEARSTHRPQHLYRWSADVFISDTGHTDINDVVLRAITDGHTTNIPDDIRKHFAFPQKGISHVEPEELHSACQALADTYFQKTQAAEFRFLNQATINGDNTRRFQRAEGVLNALQKSEEP